jgi:hypothetical protein
MLSPKNIQQLAMQVAFGNKVLSVLGSLTDPCHQLATLTFRQLIV